jgi:hypothetical protein
MIYGYARVSTDGQSVNAQVAALRKHGARRVFREVASGAKTDRAHLRRVIDQFDAGEVLLVTRLDRLARSTRDLFNLRSRRFASLRLRRRPLGMSRVSPPWQRRGAGARRGLPAGGCDPRYLRAPNVGEGWICDGLLSDLDP